MPSQVVYQRLVPAKYLYMPRYQIQVLRKILYNASFSIVIFFFFCHFCQLSGYATYLCFIQNNILGSSYSRSICICMTVIVCDIVWSNTRLDMPIQHIFLKGLKCISFQPRISGWDTASSDSSLVNPGHQTKKV